MEWNEWIGKIVFIKLEDGQIFSYSEVLAFENPFMNIRDRDGSIATFNVRSIIKIKEEERRNEREM